ncbi:hypothetical protein BC829DRAFT_419400 [Chytridium lagenaria]|nr:hypothetical protein BC829DRAFT_419400 [Chytridium lagenaria]
MYSNSGFDMLDILTKVRTRNDPKIDLGPVDMELELFGGGCEESFERLTGYTSDEIVGLNCRFLQSPDGIVERGAERKYVDNSIVYQLKRSIDDHQECQFVNINYKKGGEPFVNLITVIPVLDEASEDDSENGGRRRVKFFVGFQVDLMLQSKAILGRLEEGNFLIDQAMSAASSTAAPSPLTSTMTSSSVDPNPNHPLPISSLLPSSGDIKPFSLPQLPPPTFPTSTSHQSLSTSSPSMSFPDLFSLLSNSSQSDSFTDPTALLFPPASTSSPTSTLDHPNMSDTPSPVATTDKENFTPSPPPHASRNFFDTTFMGNDFPVDLDDMSFTLFDMEAPVVPTPMGVLSPPASCVVKPTPPVRGDVSPISPNGSEDVMLFGTKIVPVESESEEEESDDSEREDEDEDMEDHDEPVVDIRKRKLDDDVSAPRKRRVSKSESVASIAASSNGLGLPPSAFELYRLPIRTPEIPSKETILKETKSEPTRSPSPAIHPPSPTHSSPNPTQHPTTARRNGVPEAAIPWGAIATTAHAISGTVTLTELHFPPTSTHPPHHLVELKPHVDDHLLSPYHLIQNSPDVIHILSSRGILLYASPNAARDILEFESGELIGRNVSKFCHPGDLISLMRDLKTAALGERISVSYRFRRKHSGYIWVEATGLKYEMRNRKRTKCFVLSLRERVHSTLLMKDLVEKDAVGWAKLSPEGLVLHVAGGRGVLGRVEGRSFFEVVEDGKEDVRRALKAAKDHMDVSFKTSTPVSSDPVSVDVTLNTAFGRIPAVVAVFPGAVGGSQSAVSGRFLYLRVSVKGGVVGWERWRMKRRM